MRQIVLDTETTGLEVEQHHRVIEIGCVELFNRRLTGQGGLSRGLSLFAKPEYNEAMSTWTRFFWLTAIGIGIILLFQIGLNVDH